MYCLSQITSGINVIINHTLQNFWNIFEIILISVDLLFFKSAKQLVTKIFVYFKIDDISDTFKRIFRLKINEVLSADFQNNG